MHRYDDAHRGPGVIDADGLSECWLELRTFDHDWHVRAPAPSQVEFFRAHYPEDRWRSALDEHLAEEAALNYLIDAIKGGRLNIWVAPVGAPEHVVAAGAFLELGRETIFSGVYRPFNDRGYLYGRPLFVKRSDWFTFLEDLIDSIYLEPRQAKRTRHRSAGRPNLSHEAIEIHRHRIAQGEALLQPSAEAHAVHDLLMIRHADDPSYNYKVASVARALRDWRNGGCG